MKFAFLYLIGGKCKKFKFYLNKVYVHEFIIKMTCIFNCTCFFNHIEGKCRSHQHQTTLKSVHHVQIKCVIGSL